MAFTVCGKMRCFEQPSLHALFLASAAPLRSFPAWTSHLPTAQASTRSNLERSRARAFSGSNGGEVSERQTAHLEPLGGRRHVLLNSSVVASVRVMYNPAKRWVKQNVVNCWLGEQVNAHIF